MIFKTNMPNHDVSIRKHSIMKPIQQTLYHIQRRCVVKPIRYEIRAELFNSDGNARPLRNKRHNAVKPKRYENIETWNHGLVLF